MQTPEGYRRGNAPVMAKRATYTSVGPRGVWMKNAGWKKAPREVRKPLDLRTLDAIAHRKVY